jgi:hypothetical protein
MVESPPMAPRSPYDTTLPEAAYAKTIPAPPLFLGDAHEAQQPLSFGLPSPPSWRAFASDALDEDEGQGA